MHVHKSYIVLSTPSCVVAITEPGWSSNMNVIIHADCKIILKYHTCTHNLICQVRMRPKLKQTVFRVNSVNQMRQ